MLGPAPLLDLDGTLVKLPVDWPRLRDRLGVRSLDELWDEPHDRWEVVTAEEIEAARCGEPIAQVIEMVSDASCFAILTSNSAAAAVTFIARYPALADRCALVVGREELGGPKSDWQRFRAAFARCVDATALERGRAEVVYVGDAAYELDFATRLGARARSVDELVRARTVQ
jgi:phosphoglycolate phosphatase-like HAD superfamily hydrolase